jgi:uncharacterized membrane protein
MIVNLFYNQTHYLLIFTVRVCYMNTLIPCIITIESNTFLFRLHLKSDHLCWRGMGALNLLLLFIYNINNITLLLFLFFIFILSHNL